MEENEYTYNGLDFTIFYQVLAKIQEVCKEENVDYCDDGLEAIVFTAQVIIIEVEEYIQSKEKILLHVYFIQTSFL